MMNVPASWITLAWVNSKQVPIGTPFGKLNVAVALPFESSLPAVFVSTVVLTKLIVKSVYMSGMSGMWMPNRLKPGCDPVIEPKIH